MAATNRWSEFPVYGAELIVAFPIINADGDLVTGAAGLDSEISKDADTFADCTNEATEIATSSGVYFLVLTGTEMSTDLASIIVKTSTSGAKTTVLTFSPRRLVSIRANTAQAGAAGSITLDAGASAKDDFYNGLLVLITNNDPSGAQYQLRRITDYVGSTKVASIGPNWTTNPSSASTFSILLPENIGVNAWAGAALADPGTAGVPDVNAEYISDDATAADNAELMFDGTGYAGGTTKLQVDAVTAGTGLDVYQAKITLTDDNSGVNDRYIVIWHKNGMPITSGITVPKIQVIKAADGTDLVGETAMTQIGGTGLYKYDEASNRVTSGAAYIAKVTATIDASTRTWYQPVSRDS